MEGRAADPHRRHGQRAAPVAPPFDGLISLATAEDPGWYYDNWFSVGFATYALVREGESLDDFVRRSGVSGQAAAGDAMREEGTGPRAARAPAPDALPDRERGMGTFGDGTTLRVLGLVALFVLVVAVVNFTNLATARSLDRAREVGVRKSLGAARSGLAVQFLVEAVVLSVAATVLAARAGAARAAGVPQLVGCPARTVRSRRRGVDRHRRARRGRGACRRGVPGPRAARLPSGGRAQGALRVRAAGARTAAGPRRGAVRRLGRRLSRPRRSSLRSSATCRVRTSGSTSAGPRRSSSCFPSGRLRGRRAALPEIRSRLRDVPGVDGATASLTAPTFGTYSAGGSVDGPDGQSPRAQRDAFTSPTPRTPRSTGCRCRRAPPRPHHARRRAARVRAERDRRPRGRIYVAGAALGAPAAFGAGGLRWWA